MDGDFEGWGDEGEGEGVAPLDGWVGRGVMVDVLGVFFL